MYGLALHLTDGSFQRSEQAPMTSSYSDDFTDGQELRHVRIRPEPAHSETAGTLGILGPSGFVLDIVES